MNDINSDLKENKLVLVFDNFDRLPKDKILQLWSSIHVFFSENKYENIKVIIPFDREHIRNAFIDLNSKEEKEEFGNSYSEDYINKTFDVVYRVAPPILTDWKGFFEEKWKQCFGEDYNVNEFTRTRQVYELLNNKITPREIIVLINEIASLKVLHNFIIPANYLALFVINKPIILKNPIPEITNPTYLKGLEFIYKNDENLPKYITSIVYQLEPENSLEKRALNQAARELLIAQTSCWEFILYTETMVGYAHKKISDHINRLFKIYEDFKNRNVEEDWLAEIESRDNIFPTISYEIYKSDKL